MRRNIKYEEELKTRRVLFGWCRWQLVQFGYLSTDLAQDTMSDESL